MPSPLISVVLPAYDQQKQLADCLDSLLAQSFRDVEVILVADRSPDTAGGLADAYAARHPRLSVLHLNAAVGVGVSRNAGAARATGEYLLFLDADHLLPRDALQTLADRLQQTGPVDLLLFGHSRRHNDRDWPGGAEALLAEAGPEVFEPFDRPALFGAPPLIWDRLIRRGHWEEQRLAFPDGRYEEIPVVHAALLAARRIAVLPRECVQLRRRETVHPTGSPGSSVFDLFDQYERSFALLEDQPHLYAVRDALFVRMIRHYLFVFDLAGCVTRAERPPFFHRAAEHHRRFQPPGHRRPAGREGIKFSLLAGGAYPAFEMAKLSHIARGTLTGRK
ncbi:glycosyltransferase involved in cell wall biosynthesis [Kitasatospora sp. MAA19]|uniref:glycosyltransferase family 2 protein n=1 Tax=Kitasatospora sp. MAA19 TaxID=3035090 RepID=UPI0024751B90|nr:glycosyltransferase family A protein [Kitasatospora sp. MAA19]MDH6710004.1 glycosyltransferase involved in cell wall biosynthesis [Kitasatospora sp. MAA19]